MDQSKREVIYFHRYFRAVVKNDHHNMYRYIQGAQVETEVSPHIFAQCRASWKSEQ
jgi:hypothetical protein